MPWIAVLDMLAHRPSRRGYLFALGAFLTFGVSLGVYVVVWAHLRQPLHVGLRPLRFFDLRVYRGAGWRVLNDAALYRTPIVRHLGFTYPPFAALVFTPLSLFSLEFDRIAVTVVSVGVLLWTLRVALAIKRPSPARGQAVGRRAASAWALAAVAAALALWLEPITVTLGYGQIDVLIAALVVFDLSRPDSASGKGISIGLAAAIKLTPLLFIVYLLVSRRTRAAIVAALTFVATIGISFALVPTDAERYWTKIVFHSTRVGGSADFENQSLRGLFARLLAERDPAGMMVLGACVAVGAIGVLLAVRASRRGDEATGFSLCAITALLLSPVSWTHHWALAIPVLLLLATAAYERRSPTLAVATAGVLALGYAYIPERYSNHRGHKLLVAHQPLHGGLHTLAQDPYVLVGLVALAVSVASLARHLWVTRDPEHPWQHIALHIAG